jgi:class 3 adenylate cyclase
VETGLELYNCLRVLKIPCSIGITTGKAFCGDVGSTERREYAMIGDIVNLSARLMIAARTYILCDIDTYEACKNSKNIKVKLLFKWRLYWKSMSTLSQTNSSVTVLTLISNILSLNLTSQFKRLEDIMVKGKSAPIAVFQPLLPSKRDLFSAKEEKQGSTVKIVGR